MDNLLSTKFLLSVLIVILAFILILMSKIDPEVFKWIVTTVIGFYSTANVAQKFMPQNTSTTTTTTDGSTMTSKVSTNESVIKDTLPPVANVLPPIEPSTSDDTGALTTASYNEDENL